MAFLLSLIRRGLLPLVVATMALVGMEADGRAGAAEALVCASMAADLDAGELPSLDNPDADRVEAAVPPRPSMRPALAARPGDHAGPARPAGPCFPTGPPALS